MQNRKKAYAYDPVDDIDVEIDCHSAHVSTDYEHIDGSELPVIIASDFKHDPVEACQGSYTTIREIEDGCPNCGYDRMNVSVHTLAGVHREVCRACGVDITDRSRGDWEATKPTDPVESVRTSSDYIGKAGPHGMKLYQRGNAFDGLYAVIQYGNTFSFREDEILDLARLVLENMEEASLDRTTARRLLFALGAAFPEKDDEDEDAEDN